MNKIDIRSPLKVIGPRVLENYKFLRKIAKSRSEKRRLSLLQNATRDELLTLVEVASNILSTKFSLTNREKNKLAPHANYLRSLARARSEKRAKRIVQHGNGFILPALLLPIISEATRLILSKATGGGVIEDN